MSFPELPSLEDQLSVDPSPRDQPTNTKNKDIHFVSRSKPQHIGNVAPIAFGGCINAVAVHAAYQTIPQTQPPFHLYSILGAFHGPTRTDRKVNCTVTPTRTTKTFATRRIVTSQTQDDGTERTTADLFLDFHIEEPALLTFNAQPKSPSWLTDGPLHLTRVLDVEDIVSDLIRDGHVSEFMVDMYRKMFHLSTHYLHTRPCADSVTATNLLGLVPHLKTSQDHLSLPEKTSGEWIKTYESLPSEPLNMAALAFFMDQALSFVPLNHDHKGFMDAGACSTLEFALRIFIPNVDMGAWNLRERKALQGGGGRTFDEGRLWNEKGELVCSMTQVCILRPPPGEEKTKAKI